MYGFHKILLCINYFMGFLGGLVVKSLPASARDMGSTPGPGRSYALWSNKTCAPQLPSLSPRVHAPQQETPPQLESSLRLPQLEKSLSSNEDPTQPKINKQIN